MLVVADNPATSKSAKAYPVAVVSTVVVGSTVRPLNSFQVLESEASENKPKYLCVPSLYLP